MKVLCRDLGTMDYAACWELQRSLFGELLEKKGRYRDNSAARGSRASDEAGTVLLVEHPPVYTLGKSGHAENLLVDRTALERLGATFFHIDRGGDITFHGPGQLVCYPILDLERLGIGLREYIERLEEAVIRTVARYGIAAGRIAGASGVWVEEPPTRAEAESKEAGTEETRTEETRTEEAESPEGQNAEAENTPLQKRPETGRGSVRNKIAEKRTASRKICAIGVRSSRYVTMHGFALNVTTDLGWFSRINPCGFTDRGVTSIARETGRSIAMEEVKRLVLRELEEQLDIKANCKG